MIKFHALNSQLGDYQLAANRAFTVCIPQHRLAPSQIILK
jgi:hypothetical protein